MRRIGRALCIAVLTLGTLAMCIPLLIAVAWCAVFRRGVKPWELCDRRDQFYDEEK